MTGRLDLVFPSGDTHCRAWLYLPEGSGARPALVMAHGLGGIREMRLDAYAGRFAAAGYACLVFDYRHFGASGGRPRQLLDIRRQLQDWKAAVACARSRPEADPRRVVLWGTSFGGGHVLATAARDPAVAAVIAQGPFTDGVASALAMRPDSSVKVMARAVRDVAGARLGRPPVMVATAGPPGSAALMTAADAEPGYLALVPGQAPFANQVAARSALDIIRYRPGRQTAKIACPALFCVCEHDSVAPARPALRHARRAPRGEVRLYPDGHFDIGRFGSLDVVFANAGIAADPPATMATIDEARFERVVEVDLLGVWRTVRAALPHVIAARGHVLVTASVYAYVNGMANAPYAISKAGVEQLGRALRTELAIHGATAGVLYPGWVQTPIARAAFGSHDTATRMREIAYPSLLGTAITPARVAEAVARGIENRSPRIIVPRRWQPVSALRGVLGPVTDIIAERHPELRRLLRRLEESAGPTRTAPRATP